MVRRRLGAVAQALTEYGFGVVKGWMHTGQIYTDSPMSSSTRWRCAR